VTPVRASQTQKWHALLRQCIHLIPFHSQTHKWNKFEYKICPKDIEKHWQSPHIVYCADFVIDADEDADR
jgi:hypothetical protein